MFKLDDNFLNGLGLGDMPSEQKKPFLQHIYQELEIRVGAKLSDGMSDDQLVEFESIIDNKDDHAQSWLENNIPNYRADETFINLKSKNHADSSDSSLMSEYAATKWLELHRPDYKKVVEDTLDSLKKEIISNRDKILG